MKRPRDERLRDVDPPESVHGIGCAWDLPRELPRHCHRAVDKERLDERAGRLAVRLQVPALVDEVLAHQSRRARDQWRGHARSPAPAIEWPKRVAWRKTPPQGYLAGRKRGHAVDVVGNVPRWTELRVLLQLVPVVVKSRWGL